VSRGTARIKKGGVSVTYTRFSNSPSKNSEKEDRGWRQTAKLMDRPVGPCFRGEEGKRCKEAERRLSKAEVCVLLHINDGERQLA